MRAHDSKIILKSLLFKQPGFTNILSKPPCHSISKYSYHLLNVALKGNVFQYHIYEIIKECLQQKKNNMCPRKTISILVFLRWTKEIPLDLDPKWIYKLDILSGLPSKFSLQLIEHELFSEADSKCGAMKHLLKEYISFHSFYNMTSPNEMYRF